MARLFSNKLKIFFDIIYVAFVWSGSRIGMGISVSCTRLTQFLGECRTRSNRSPSRIEGHPFKGIKKIPPQVVPGGTLNHLGILYVLCVDGPGSRVFLPDTGSLPTQLLDVAHDVGTCVLNDAFNNSYEL